MSAWFLFALASAFSHSLNNLCSKFLVSKIPKSLIGLGVYFFATVSLFVASFINGIPDLGEKFLIAVLITGILNVFAYFAILRAYELADLSLVFPMILLTPVILMGTSYFILGEKPSLLGFLGVIVVLLGLFFVVRNSDEKLDQKKIDSKKGIMYGILVAIIWSISINFDKIAVLNSDSFFAGACISLIMFFGIGFVFLQQKNYFYIERKIFKYFPIIFITSIFSVITIITHFKALSMGLASYTIVIKRTAVLFGVIWGVLFFKEKNFLPKIIGSAIAVAGIALILLSQ
ncbi:DMT family transporter [Patescibacteria group bacterium]|nr:DMT family transporter [Patescibacteria group bacterium]